MTLILIFMFAVFGGGSALGIIKLPFPPVSGDTDSSVSDTIKDDESRSPEINIPTGIQIYDPQMAVSSKIEETDTESSISEEIKDTNTKKDGAYLVELSGSTGSSNSSSAATSSAPVPGQDTGNSSNSLVPAPVDPGSSSGSASENSSSSSNGTVIPSSRPKPSPSGGGGSHSVAVQSVALDQSEVTINRKNTLQLTATITPSNATHKTVTWTTSNKDVATVDSTGKVIAVGTGTTTITATAGQKSATCEVTVVVLMDGIALNHTELVIDKGSTEQLTAKIIPEDTTDDKAITWTSTAPETVSVDAAGKVTALKPGKATIRASAVGASASCEITVLSPMTGITLDKSNLTLNRNTTGKLTVSFLPDDTTSGREIIWSSSAPEVADVDHQGNVVAHGIGTAKITASCGEFTASCDVSVIALIEGIYLDQTEMTLDRGTDGQLTASIVPLDTTEDKTVVWTSSDPGVATVDSTGKVTGVKIGTATILATVGSHTTSCDINVVALIHSISLDKNDLTLDRGTTGKLTVSYDPPDTTEDKTVTWSSSNSDVATVDASGNVTAVQIGTTTITAQVGTHATTCSITVVALIHSISLDKSDMSLDRGTAGQLTVSYDPADTTEDKTAVWTSSNPDIATVDSTGKVTALKIGVATITATVGEHTASCSITVVALIHNITLNKTELTLDRGISDQLTLTIDPPDTTEDKTVVWTSSDPTVATVDSTGKITALKIGSAVITATIGEHTASCTVNVVALIKSIALDKAALTLDRGSTGQLSVSYTPADTTESKAVTWSSSDPSVATVDNSGKVTGVKVGTATITAKVGTHTASSRITVVALIKSITLDKTSLTLDRGTTGQLAVSINPSDTTESKAVTWSSSNTAVAIVDSTGKVTAVKIGSAIITAKVGKHTASCTINVVALIKNISLDKTDIHIDKGASEQLTVSFDPVDTTESKVVAWSSNRPDIATVDAAGRVTAIGSGQVIITAKVGSHTASCAVSAGGIAYSIEVSKDYNSDLSKWQTKVNSDGSGSFNLSKYGESKHPVNYKFTLIVRLQQPVKIIKGQNLFSFNGAITLNDDFRSYYDDGDNISSGFNVYTNLRPGEAYVTDYPIYGDESSGTYIKVGSKSFVAPVRWEGDLTTIYLKIPLETDGRWEDGWTDFKMEWPSGGIKVLGQPITAPTGYLYL